MAGLVACATTLFITTLLADGGSLPTNTSTLFAYRKSQHPSSGNWWGPSIFVPASSSSPAPRTLLAAGLLKLDSPLHETPTSCQIKRSTDDGKSWSEAVVLVQDPRTAPQYVYGCGGFVHSSANDTLYYTFLNGTAGSNGAWPMFLLRSEDGGETWSSPLPVANSTTHFTAGEILSHGIELSARGGHAGRLVVPVNQFFGNKPVSPVTPRGQCVCCVVLCAALRCAVLLCGCVAVQGAL